MDFEQSTETEIAERILRHAYTFLCTYKLNRSLVANAPVNLATSDACWILLNAMREVERAKR